MRAAGRVVAEMHQGHSRRGPSRCHHVATRPSCPGCAEPRRATSNFLGYHGYPAVICASVNDEVVHGIPNERPLQIGDIVSIDCGAIVNGWHGDAAPSRWASARSMAEAKRLIDTADRALAAAVAAMNPGGHLGDVGAAVESVAQMERPGYGSPGA